MNEFTRGKSIFGNGSMKEIVLKSLLRPALGMLSLVAVNGRSPAPQRWGQSPLSEPRGKGTATIARIIDWDNYLAIDFSLCLGSGSQATSSIRISTRGRASTQQLHDAFTGTAWLHVLLSAHVSNLRALRSRVIFQAKNTRRALKYAL